MKKLFYLSIVILFVACGQDDTEHTKIIESSIEDDLMSEGNELDPGSRRAYEILKYADPNTGEIPPNIRLRELYFAQHLPYNESRAFNWTQRGPVNVGGRTRAIAIDVLDENIWFAGGVTGGIWRSTDAGTSWNKVTDPLDVHSITSITQDTRAGKENIWYAGTGEHYGIVSHTTFEARFSGNGVLKSTDNGLSWFPLTSTQSNTPETYASNGDMDFVWRMITDPVDMVNDIVLAAVYNGIKRSDDGGTTWTEVLGFTTGGLGDPACNYADLVSTTNGVFYASLSSDGPSKGIYRSDDGGLSWANITPTTMPGSYGRMAIAINPQNENELWFFGNSSGFFGNGHSLLHYNYVSGDGSGTGGLWDDRSASLPDQSCITTGLTVDLGLLSTQSSFDVHIAVHPADSNVIYIAGTSIWRNSDGFTNDSTNTWIGGYQCNPLSYNDLDYDYQYPNHHPDQHYLTFLPSDPNVLINVNDGGIFKTTDNLLDSISWISLNNGYITSQFYAVAIEPGETTSDVVIGGLQDNGTWFTNTSEFDSTWKFIGLGDGMFCAITENLEYYITSSQRGKLRIKTIDPNGVVTGHERIDPEGGPNTYNWANPLKLDANDPNRLYWNGRTKVWYMPDLTAVDITGNRIDKESDSLWVKILETQTSGPVGIITDLEVALSAPNTLWYGSSSGKLFRVDDVDTAPNKTELTGIDFPSNSYLASISVNPYNIDQIVVTFANYGIPSVFFTDDGGITWDDISGNLEENPDGTGSGPACSWVEYYPDGTIFIGTSVGLLTTTFPDGQNTLWTLEPGIGNVVINHMDYRTFDGKFVVGTHGQGVYSTNMPPAFAGMNDYSSQEGITVYPTLADDFINVVVEKANEISIFNLNGQLVYQGNVENGLIQINVAGLESGVYIVRASSGNNLTTKKFVKR